MATTTTSAPGTVGVPVMDGVARVHAVLDTVDAGAVGAVSGRDVAEVERAISRLESLKLTMVAAADAQDAGSRAGLSGTSAWLAAHTRSWGGKAAADVLLATALQESLPVTKAALADGTVSTAHATVIAHATSRLPESLTDAGAGEGRDGAGAPGQAGGSGAAAASGSPGPARRAADRRRGRRPRGRAAALPRRPAPRPGCG